MHTEKIYSNLRESVEHFNDYKENGHAIAKLLLMRASLSAAQDAVESQIQVHLAEAKQKTAKRPSTPISQFFAVADAHGLDTRNDDGMRLELSKLLGREIKTRKSLTMDEWLIATNAIEDHRLSWQRREAAAA